MAALAGGVVAEASGGAFKNGALTSAIQFVYNQLGDRSFPEKESFASYFGKRMMSGQVRNDIFDYGIGLAEGGISVIKGLYNFGGQAYRHLSGDTQANWEEFVSNETLSLYIASDTIRSHTNRVLFNQASDLKNYSARNIGHLTGRFITGALGGRYVNTFTGVTAGVGDGAAAINRGGDFVMGFIFGDKNE